MDIDAYRYEAAQIANAQRDLNARFHALIAKVRTEHPELFEADTDWMFAPDATEAEHFGHYIQGHDHYINYLRKG